MNSAFPSLQESLSGRADLDQRLASFPLKGQIVIVSAFISHQLCHCSMKADIGNTETNGCGCVS